jgi:hypothetical protein
VAIPVTATVASTCRVKTQSFDFALDDFDRADPTSLTEDQALGDLTLRCSAGSAATIRIFGNRNADGLVGHVTWQNTDQASYEVYQDAIAIRSGELDGPFSVAAAHLAERDDDSTYDFLPVAFETDPRPAAPAPNVTAAPAPNVTVVSIDF